MSSALNSSAVPGSWQAYVPAHPATVSMIRSKRSGTVETIEYVSSNSSKTRLPLVICLAVIDVTFLKFHWIKLLLEEHASVTVVPDMPAVLLGVRIRYPSTTTEMKVGTCLMHDSATSIHRSILLFDKIVRSTSTPCNNVTDTEWKFVQV